MSTERGDQEKCVICWSDLISSTAGGVRKQKDQRNVNVNNEMKYQVRAVFVLRKLLGISNSTCCDLLQFGNPSTWLSYCFECFETVIEAEKVFSKLVKLERKWTDLKKSVEEKIGEEKYPKQITRNISNIQNAELIHRIRKEAVDRLQSLHQKFDSPTINSVGVKIENDEEEDFNECASPGLNDYQSSEEDIAMTQSNANSVLQNNESQEQGRSRVEVSTPELTVKEHSKNKVDRRTRSGRLIKSKYDSDGDDAKNNDEYEPDHDLVEKDDNNLMEPVEKSKNLQCSKCDRVFGHSYGLHYHQLRFHGTDSEKPFRCELCGLGMYAERSLSRHIEKQHTGQTESETRSCYKCFSNFSTKSELMDHVCESTNKIRVFECKECAKTFSIFSLYKKHAKSHKLEKITENFKLRLGVPFKCHKCPRVFPSFESRKRHTLRIHASAKEKPYPCEKCEKGFLTHKYLRYHDVKHHDGPPIRANSMYLQNRKRIEIVRHRERNVPCSQCDLLFPSENMVECHIKKVHDCNFSVPCTLCSKPFPTTYGMKKHLRNVHHKEKKFICEICSKLFTYAASLRHHQMSKHEKSELLKCKVCDHFAADPFSLRKHIEVVHNKSSLKFKCPVCSHVTISQSRLNAHILGRHTNEKPFACTECDKSYVNGSSLKIHMRSHTGERPFECQFCKKKFYTNFKRKRHEEDMHSTEKAFQCEKCGKNFPSKHYLKTHDYDVHRKRQKNPVPEKVLINNELLKEAISQNTAEIVKTNVVGLILEKSLQNP